jgi:hypothetical protein
LVASFLGIELCAREITLLLSCTEIPLKGYHHSRSQETGNANYSVSSYLDLAKGGMSKHIGATIEAAEQTRDGGSMLHSNYCLAFIPSIGHRIKGREGSSKRFTITFERFDEVPLGRDAPSPTRH